MLSKPTSVGANQRSRLPVGVLSIAAAAALGVAATALSPATGFAESRDTGSQNETAFPETLESFTAWARNQVEKLDSKIDEATKDAARLGAKTTAKARAEWRDARQTIERQRKVVGKRLESLEDIAGSEWQDAMASAKQSLVALDEEVDAYRKMIMSRDKPKPANAGTNALSDADEKALRDRIHEQQGTPADLPANVAD